MQQKLNVIRVRALSGLVWQVQRPRPEVREDGTLLYPDSIVESMVLLGSDVEVFVRDKSPNKGYRISLLPPTINLVMSFLSAADWNELLSEVPEEERLDEVAESEGDVWTRGGGFPPDDPNAATIAAITEGAVDGSVRIFILPSPMSEFTQAGLCMLVTLLPLTVSRLEKRDIPLDLYKRMQVEAVQKMDEFEFDLEYEDEDEEGEDDDGEPAVAAPTAPATPAPPTAIASRIAASILDMPPIEAAKLPAAPNSASGPTE